MYVNENLTRIYKEASSDSSTKTASAKEASTQSPAAAPDEKPVMARVNMDLLSISNLTRTEAAGAEADTRVKLMEAAVKLSRGAAAYAYQDYLNKLEEAEEEENSNQAAEYDQTARDSLLNSRMDSVINRRA